MNRNMITMMAMVMKLVMASTKKMKKTLVMTMLTRGVKNPSDPTNFKDGSVHVQHSTALWRISSYFV